MIRHCLIAVGLVLLAGCTQFQQAATMIDPVVDAVGKPFAHAAGGALVHRYCDATSDEERAEIRARHRVAAFPRVGAAIDCRFQSEVADERAEVDE